MTHWTQIPNDIVVEILQYLKFRELIRFNLVGKSYFKLIKRTRWNHCILRNLKYLAVGYKFAKCTIAIRDYTSRFDTKLMATALRNLSRCKNVTIKYSNISYMQHMWLSRVHELKFINCDFGPAPFSIYIERFSKVPKISFVNCEGPPGEFIPKMNVDKLVIGRYNHSHSINYPCYANVRELDLEYCLDITDSVLELFANIEVLRLGYSGSKNNGLSNLLAKQGLTMKISKRITDNGLAHLTNVRKLDLANCISITNRGLVNLNKLTKLNIVNCTNVSGDVLIHLPNLEKLVIGDCDVRDQHLQFIQNIKVLELSDCDQITDAGIGYLKNLRKLKLVDCGGITDDGLKNLTTITNLTVFDFGGISDRVLSYLENITKLSVANCDSIIYNGIHYLTKLIELNSVLTLEQFRDIVPEIKNIESLQLHCVGITDDDLIYLAHLDKLVLFSCENITDWGLKHLANVRVLKMHNNNLVTDEGVEYLYRVERLRLIGFSNIKIGWY